MNPTTAETAPAKPVPEEVLRWADEQDFRAAVKRVINALRLPPRRKGDHTQPLWGAVMVALGVGSTYAHRYCILFGYDPEELVRYAQ